MQVTEDDEFEDPALEWLHREVARLAATLRSAGVVEDMIRPICHDFMGGLAYGLDSEPVKVGGVPFAIRVIATHQDGHSVTATDLFLFHEMS